MKDITQLPAEGLYLSNVFAQWLYNNASFTDSTSHIWLLNNVMAKIGMKVMF